MAARAWAWRFRAVWWSGWAARSASAARSGRGATFWFTAQFEKQPRGAEEAVRRPPEKLRVLIVDDNAACRRALGAMLDAWGIRHAEARGRTRGNPDPARRQRRWRIRFRSRLLDMQMPVMSGFAVTEEIKADPALARLQIIMMHTVGRRGSSASWAEAGSTGT